MHSTSCVWQRQVRGGENIGEVGGMGEGRILGLCSCKVCLMAAENAQTLINLHKYSCYIALKKALGL